MLIQGGVLSVKNCTVCGEDHDAVEVEYLSPPVNIDGEEYNLIATCPKTGTKFYISTGL